MDTATLAHILATLNITQASSALGVPNALLVTDDAGNIGGVIGGGGTGTPVPGLAYVSDTTGDDGTGDGSIAAPFKTIAAAMTKFTTDATGHGAVALLPGVYTDTFTVLGTLGTCDLIGTGNVVIQGTGTIASGGGSLTCIGVEVTSLSIAGGTWDLDIQQSTMTSITAAGSGTTQIAAETSSTVSASGDYALTWDVTPAQVGNTDPQWNADKLLGIDLTAPVASDTFLFYDGANITYANAVRTTADAGATGESIVSSVVGDTINFATIDTTTAAVTVSKTDDVINIDLADADQATPGVVTFADAADITSLTATDKVLAPADIATIRDSSEAFNADRIVGKAVNIPGITDGQTFAYASGTDTFIPADIFTEVNDGPGAGESLIDSTTAATASLVTLSGTGAIELSLSSSNIEISAIAATDLVEGVMRFASTAEHTTPVSNTIAATPAGVDALIQASFGDLVGGYDIPVSIKGVGPYTLVSGDRGSLISVDGTLTIPNTLAVGFTCYVLNAGTAIRTITTSLFVEGGKIELAPNHVHKIHIYKVGGVLVSTWGPGDLDLDDVSDSATYVRYTPAEQTKLAGLNNTTDADIETGYNNQVPLATSPEMSAGTEASTRRMSPLLTHEAITARFAGTDVETSYNNQVPAATTIEMETGTETAIRRLSPSLVSDAITERLNNAGIANAESIWTIPIDQPLAANDTMEMYYDHTTAAIKWRDTPTVANTMTTDVYDPFGTAADVYDLNNSTGFLNVAKITGLETDTSTSGTVTIHSDVSSAGSGIIISAQERTDIGLNTSHRNSLLNPHGVDAATVGNTVAQWNANLLQGTAINALSGATDDGKSPVFDFSTNTIIWGTPGGGGGGEANDLSLDAGALGESLRISKPSADIIIKGIAGAGNITVSTVGSDIVIALPTAAEGITGAAPIATSALVAAGTDNASIVSPQGLAGKLVDYSTRFALKKVTSGPYQLILADAGYDVHIDDTLTLGALADNFTCILRNNSASSVVISLSGVTVVNGALLNLSGYGTAVVTYDSATTVWINGDLQV